MGSEFVTLQELSIKVIIDEFSSYTTAYRTTEDECFKKNLLFLQKVYSYSLFQELDKKGKLKEDHLDFLLNDYLRQLDVGCLLSLTPKENIVKKAIPIVHSLTDLTCDREYNMHDCINTLKELLPHATSVNRICIPYFCNDELLKLIASSCSQLNELNIYESSDVTSDGLEAFYSGSFGVPKCPLRYINLIDTSVGDDAVASLLKNVPSLEEVLFPRLPNVLLNIHQKDIDNNIITETKYNLTSLDFSLNDDITLSSSFLRMCSEICPNVKKLVIPISKAEDLEVCCLFSKLEDISILNERTLDTTFDLNCFLQAKGKNLKHLTVYSFGLSISNLIDSCPNLESLVLKSVQYQEMNHQTTKTLSHLRSLQLDSVIFLDFFCTESVMTLLNSCPDLESLSLFYCDFNDSDIVQKLSTYSSNCKLKHLGFDYSDVEYELLHQFIFNCSSLRSLSLDSCENLSIEDIHLLNHTLEACNRKTEINFVEDEDFVSSYSDYEVEYDGDFDIDDFDDCNDDFDDEDEDEDDDYAFNNPGYW